MLPIPGVIASAMNGAAGGSGPSIIGQPLGLLLVLTKSS